MRTQPEALREYWSGFHAAARRIESVGVKGAIEHHNAHLGNSDAFNSGYDERLRRAVSRLEAMSLD